MFADKKALLAQIKIYKEIVRWYLIYWTAPLFGQNCSVHWLLHFLEADLALQNDNEKTFLIGHLFRRGYFQHIEKKHTIPVSCWDCRWRISVSPGSASLGGFDSLVSSKIKLPSAMPLSGKAKEKTDVKSSGRKNLLLVNKN